MIVNIFLDIGRNKAVYFNATYDHDHEYTKDNTK